MSLECLRFLQEEGVDLDNELGSGFSEFSHLFQVRDKFIRRFGFAILTERAIGALRPCAPLLEVGAGSGYWSYELRRAQIDVVPTDPASEEFGACADTPKKWWSHHWVDVEKLTALDALAKYPERNLLFVWPSYALPWAAEALAAFSGRHVIYVGEGRGGCTADDRFHDLLERDYEESQRVRLPQFQAIHDDMTVYTRKIQ